MAPSIKFGRALALACALIYVFVPDRWDLDWLLGSGFGFGLCLWNPYREWWSR